MYIDTKANCAPSLCVNQIPNTGGDQLFPYNINTITLAAPISIANQTFTTADLHQYSFNGTTVVLIFNQALANDISPLMFMSFENTTIELSLGGISNPFIGSIHFLSPNTISAIDLINPAEAQGTMVTHVTGFAGTPGLPQCHGKSVSALAHKYGGMAQAAIALKYSSVDALQADITLFCGS